MLPNRLLRKSGSTLLLNRLPTVDTWGLMSFHVVSIRPLRREKERGARPACHFCVITVVRKVTGVRDSGKEPFCSPGEKRQGAGIVRRRCFRTWAGILEKVYQKGLRTRLNGQVVFSKHIILTFNIPILPTRIKATYPSYLSNIPHPFQCLKCHY